MQLALLLFVTLQYVICSRSGVERWCAHHAVKQNAACSELYPYWYCCCCCSEFKRKNRRHSEPIHVNSLTNIQTEYSALHKRTRSTAKACCNNPRRMRSMTYCSFIRMTHNGNLANTNAPVTHLKRKQNKICTHSRIQPHAMVYIRVFFFDML